MRPMNRPFALIVLAGALALSACGKKDEQEAPMTNNLVEPPVENIVVDEPDVVMPEPGNNVVATPPAPPPSVSEEQQILDDAAASGMTSRLPEEGDKNRPADETSQTGE